MIIRNAEKKDIERILEVFASAKAYMRKMEIQNSGQTVIRIRKQF